ncbi:two-component system response regulator RppA [Fischerella thermalis]|jgi:OmpR-family two-component system manganese-sensing response regulator|uniref:Two component transcriptional regulator, winged helix family n=1 Tax=Fischerella thermalis JSC-11 TaxID=741277 RepID=G6FT15_9CYAN|nr:two-component system response regulator RppA [Fischerella thermalis]PLZ75954.1 DNA-binding response regulator [Fischerella thermalis WC217]PMB05593.1 DNA-binding response regulator [Fischerella thermalis CCMEE 5328]PMB05983.1 DNA-binding response regulator [Fischerella thermalis CCMEE 5273]PMB48876.1 DNA-binding response regulator [Fischerella thermalis CCMEE 5205]EHC15001.1 two component transcriptional regulator, winged helix family [Fischerella thermalis JSC-11]
MRILVVDDEIELTDPLSRILSREGYSVDAAYDGTSGGQLAQTSNYDLLILDWMLPGKTGLEICQELRRRGITTPVLFLTAKDTLDDRVEGLDAGADDYLVKPFELRELLARVRALLRRSVSQIPGTLTVRLTVADLELDPENQVAYRQGRVIELSQKESQLLQYFMENTGKLLTHTQIMQYLWQDNEQPSSNVIAALVRLLRRKIELTGETQLIHSVYGKGYRFGISNE